MPQKKSVALKIKSNIEELGAYTVGSRHEDKIARCRFFLVPGDGLMLLGMPDIKLLNLLKIMWGVVGDQKADRKFKSQTIWLSNGPKCKANTGQQIKADNVDINNDNSNMPE